MEPIFLPIPDACRVLGVGRSKLYELIAAGDISIRKIGRKTLVPREELTSFAARLAGRLQDRGRVTNASLRYGEARHR